MQPHVGHDLLDCEFPAQGLEGSSSCIEAPRQAGSERSGQACHAAAGDDQLDRVENLDSDQAARAPGDTGWTGCSEHLVDLVLARP